MQDVTFKQVTTAEELRQVQQLNHRTFAEELGQYATNASGELVDRFHELNRYFVAKDGETVIGMISINGTQPFSIEKRLSANTAVLRELPNPSEVRLLAVTADARRGIVLAGLFWQVYQEARRQGRSHLLISGVADRAEMYRSIGFRDLGAAVPEGKTSYIPMMVDLSDSTLERKARRFMEWWKRRAREEVSLLPGPVQLSRGVRRAFEQLPLSHREDLMVETYIEVKRRLSTLAEGMPVAVMTGSGTLANDVVAACLRARFRDSPGLVLVNGEFGERLLRQAKAAGLRFQSVQCMWGEEWNKREIEQRLQSSLAWVWCVHLETSTGQLNDLHWLSERCAARNVSLAADCVSSLGAAPLTGCSLALASGVSGKALGAYAGLAFVFADRETLRNTSFDKLPATFDVQGNIDQREPMYTVASPQLLALNQALKENYDDAESSCRRYEHYAALGAWVRSELRRRGVEPVVDGESAAPVICSFPMPDAESAQRCRSAGFRIGHESAYLRQRGWGQISVMGDLSESSLGNVFDALLPGMG